MSDDYENVTEEMRTLARYATEAFDNTLDIVGQTGREGWQEVAGYRQKNYTWWKHVAVKET